MTAEEAYDALFDRAVSHRVDIERYAAGEVREILRFLLVVERSTLRKVAALQVDPSLDRSERARLQSLEGLLREIRLIYADGYSDLTRRFMRSMDDLAEFEAEFQSQSLARALDDLGSIGATGAGEAIATGGAARVLSPTVAQLRAVVRSKPLTTETQAGLLEDWLSSMTRAHIERAESALRIAFIEGESVDRMAARLRDVSRLNSRGAEALARTSFTHIAAEVAQETYRINGDIVQGVEWVAVLDSRTTPICRNREGKRWPIDKGPRPPAHIRCRSTIIPVLDGFPAPKRMSWAQWLARQPARVQDEALGPTRGRLFRQGGLKIERFDSPDGRPLTLAQLRIRHAEAFRRANID